MFAGSHDFGQTSAGQNVNGVLSVQLGAAKRVDLTTDWRNDVDRIRIAVLRRIGVCDSDDIARTLYQSVLEAASSGDHGTSVLPRIADSGEHAIHRRVWRAGRGPQRVVVLQHFVRNLVRRKPFDSGFDAG